MKQYKQLAIIGGLWGVLLSILLLFDPQEAPLLVLIAPFVVFALAMYITIKFLLQHSVPFISVTKRNIIALLSSLVPTFLLLLSSVEQLTVRDVILVLLFVTVVSFYVRKSHLFSR